jgi:S1-C subfamily serine protease
MTGLVAALLVSAVGGGAVGATLTRATTPATATPPIVSAPPAPIQPVANSAGVAAVYRKVGPAVVQIGQQRGGRVGGTGSGFVIAADGSILTNNHVVEGARSLRVMLADGREFPAQVLGRSPANDLALIKIEPPAGGLPVVELGDSSTVAPGDLAIAIGSPLGLDKTITSGIVSAVNRDLRSGPIDLKGLIQTDAAINPGNSGGPLLNAEGQVVGINSVGAMGISGIGFAVPINTAKDLLPRLKAGAVGP